MTKVNTSSNPQKEENSYRTEVKSVNLANTKWSGSVNNNFGKANVTVNSVSSLFSRTLQAKVS